MAEPEGGLFTLEEPTIEEVAHRLGEIYAPVSLSRDPMFSWVLIVNDVTILGEDLRRERREEAVDRAGSVLARLLEFVGYHTYVHQMGAGEMTDIVADSLRQQSYSHYMSGGLREGPSRWILAKYPFVCSKCGKDQCQCLMAPWILENRREEPEEYVRRFQSQAEDARQRLNMRVLQEFTLKSLIDHFGAIYRANYYHQDPWKIGMHLSEEMGEATTELGRMQLRWRAERAGVDVIQEIPAIVSVAADRTERQITKIKEPKERERYRAGVKTQLAQLQTALKKDPWALYGRLVAEKFKEETADIFSWLVAIVVKLDPTLERFKEFPNRFIQTGKGGVRFLACPWCREAHCSNGCLLAHGISSELTEKVLKF